ncbi:MAG: hypothetical protein IKU40_03150 [Clostridia bacterium]|nr:hypothetical protein [Clostridia bacterium]
MEYISEASYEYIMKKYRTSPDARFVRNDALFSEDSGHSAEEIMALIRRQDAELSDLPHPVRKAKAFACVLDNTRICCDPRDPFPAIHMIDRPLNATLISAWNHEIFSKVIPEVNPVREQLERNAAATMWSDYDHSVPYWDRILSLGFPGLLWESEQARAAQQEVTPEMTAFYDGIRITYEAVLRFLRRLEAQAVRQGAGRMAAALRNLQTDAPSGFYEALLTDYLYFMLSEHIEGLQARSLANFDRTFYPFYQSDLASGVTEEEIRSDLAHFFLQFTAIGNYWGQPVYLGGCTENEGTVINRLSYLFLDVYDRMGIYNPKVQIKIAGSTPKPFVRKALDMIRRGNNSIVFVSDATIRKSLMNSGASAEEARMCDISGCYEYCIRGGIAIGMQYMNLLKPLEFALHGGCDGISGEPVGEPCPAAEEYEDFGSFFAEYKRQLAALIGKVVRTVNTFENYLHQVNPQSLLSAGYPECIRRGRDALGGGAADSISTIQFGFMANAADSLANIKKYVFDKKMLTLAELRDILDADYAGNERLRRIFLADPDKYGNNKDLSDRIAAEIADFVSGLLCGQPNAPVRGGHWTCGFHVARMSYNWAGSTASSADGRRRGEELSKNLSASMGMNREGATAAILSVTKIDASGFGSDACLDLGLLPSAVQGEDGLTAMQGLLDTFVRRGGHAMHINVFNADTLRKAQQEPEKYKDLQIRVCGWNVLFNNINREEQDGFIRQAESLV